MSFAQLVSLFTTTGITGSLLVMPDGSLIATGDFESRFQTGYDTANVYTSLVANANCTPAWKAIFDTLKTDGKIS